MATTTDIPLAPALRSAHFTRTCASADSVRTKNDRERENSFEFLDKTRFTARAETTWKRSRHFTPHVEEKLVDVWTLKPPDFNAQAFKTKTLPRNSRAAIRPEKYETESSKRYEKLIVSAEERKRNRRREEELANMARQASSVALPQSPIFRRPPFDVHVHIFDTHEAKLDFVKNGMYPQSQYEMPKPHDFRQLPQIKTLGLPEFLTSYERDPMGLKFKTKRLSTITGPTLKIVEREVERGASIESRMEEPPSWQKELILPKAPFPNKLYAYTRHRRTDRSARSAFLERAETMMMKRAQKLTLAQARTKKQYSQNLPHEFSPIPALSTVSRSAILSEA